VRSEPWIATAGILAGLVSIVDGLPYIHDTWTGLTRPHRGTWSIWSVLAIVAFSAQIANDGLWSLVMVGTQALFTTTICVLSMRRGEGGLSRVDAWILGLAGAGVVGWLISSNPLVATACVVFADSLGVAMMLPKTWRDPHSETLVTFALASLAGALGAAAVGGLDMALLLYPAYFAVINATIAAVIWGRRRAIALPTLAGD
jgi:hypothetical protein